MSISSKEDWVIFQDVLDLSPIGCLTVNLQIKNRFLTRLILSTGPLDAKVKMYFPSLSAHLKSYLLRSNLSSFPLPIFVCGSLFEKRVWSECLKIPPGNTISYGELAQRISCRSPMAVGQALKRNPLPIIIPCHRVVAKDGGLTGFSCGIEIKKILIEFEKSGVSAHENSHNE